MPSFRTYIEVEVEVSYTYVPASRGARDSLGGRRGAGPPLEPDEPATVEINSCKYVLPEPDLEKNLERLEVECWNHRGEQGPGGEMPSE